MPFVVDECVRIEGVDVADAHDQHQDVACGEDGVEVGSEGSVALALLDRCADVASSALVEGLQRSGDLGVLRGGVGELDDESSRELALRLGVGEDDVGDLLLGGRGAEVRDGVVERRLEGVASDGDEQVGLAREVPVDRGDRDAGVGGDRLRGGGVEAVGGEQLERLPS